MKHSALQDENCSIARTLAVLGERWTLVILRQTFMGRRRFDDIQRDLGVARNILTERLGTLVAEGILERRRYLERPPRDEYRLTPKGRDLYPVLISLMQWGDRYTAGESGPPLQLVHLTCGHATSPAFVCSHCGDVMDPREVRPEPGPGVLAGAT
ncbi:MAG: winged helix-turn-helix transcriptional regulator [Solirubrobacteraceae bacterium]